MISSEPAEFLDHDHLEDFEGRIYVAVGNTHPPGAVISYLKYVPTSSRTFWCRGDKCFERVIKRYGVESVLGSIRGHQEECYEPTLGVTVPVVRTSSLLAVYKPRDRLREILKRPADEVELDVVLAFERLRAHSNVPPDHVGVDGSIVVGIHNPRISDVDLVVYGCRESIEVSEASRAAFERLPHDVEIERLFKMSEIYELPLEVVRRISAPYKRLYMRDRRREVNIMFSPERASRYGERVTIPLAVAEADLVVSPGHCESLYYPGIAPVERVYDLAILATLRRVPADLSSPRVSKVITYESLYSYPLYMGGRVRVRGVLSLEKPGEELTLVVGTREAHSYVVPRG